jgi:hypothetical protein
MVLKPERARSDDWIRSYFPPPIEFIAAAVNFAVMPPAKWDRELVANFAPKSTALGKAQMMGVRGLSTADQAGALGD